MVDATSTPSCERVNRKVEAMDTRIGMREIRG
jgi:hypothetical protein